jgi:tRNA A37 threonylcarbamoyltransferase TsaD
MKAFVKAAALPALLLLASGCQVNVDNRTEAQLDNAGDALGAGLDKAGDAIGNAADKVGNAVEQGADSVDHGVRTHVKVHMDKDDKTSGNKQ